MSTPCVEADVIVVGAGIAGASIAYFMAPHARVLVLEREPHPGMHATGRSAAMFMESYGSAQVRLLTRASRAFLERPPAGFAAQPLIAPPRGALYVGAAAEADAVHALREAVAPHAPGARLLDAAQVRALVPVLEPAAAQCGLLDPGAADLDVNELHQGYLRAVRAHGGRIVCDAEARTIEHSSGQWEVSDGDRGFKYKYDMC